MGAEFNRYVADGRLRKVARGKGLLKKCEAEELIGELGYDVEGA